MNENFEKMLLILAGIAVCLLLLTVWIILYKRRMNKLKRILKKHNLIISELTTGLDCTYIGGSLGCNVEAKHVVVGVKDGYLKFFRGVLLYYNDDLSSRGTINWIENPAHLFNIPINENTTVEIIDDRSKITVIYGFVPISWEIGDFAVFINWVDGNYPCFAEFRIKGNNSRNRAYILRNTLFKMIKENVN